MKDLIKCCNCDFEGLVETGTELCPKCKTAGHLSWIPGKPQEVKDDYFEKEKQ